MIGFLLLEGGAEFGGRMAEPDLRAIQLAGGLNAPISILPTAAAPDNNHGRAGGNGLRWFNRLGASEAAVVPLIDKSSADQAAIASALRNSRLIYLLGGFPRYLAENLSGSIAWQAMLEAYHQGAVIGGSSAGAMVLCQHYYDPHTKRVMNGLDLVPNACILPHHDTFGKGWASQLAKLLPQDILIGIDEQTGMIDDGADAQWNVYGKGSIVLYKGGEIKTFHPGESFSL